ncbi:MAG TPA: cyclic nucleotide-binding domain-containing protein [Actinomycetota bacterium]|nr:cyclic nucleotide-binding domain-containing protein [Actinomycetota bacterium]
MGVSTIAARLGEIPIFTGCSKRDLSAIARVVREIDHETGSVIAVEGEPGAGLFVIDTGRANVSIGGARVNTLGPGDFFGEMALLDGGPRTATVTAATELQLFALTGWAFRGLVSEHPQMAMRVMETMAARLRAATEHD